MLLQGIVEANVPGYCTKKTGLDFMKHSKLSNKRLDSEPAAVAIISSIVDDKWIENKVSHCGCFCKN